MTKQEYIDQYVALNGPIPPHCSVIPSPLGWQIIDDGYHANIVVCSAKEDIESSISKSLLPEHITQFHQFMHDYRDTIDWVLWNNETDPNTTTPSYHNSRHLIGAAFIAQLLSAGDPKCIQAMFIHDFQHPKAASDLDNIIHSLSVAKQCDYPHEIDDVLTTLVFGTQYNPQDPYPAVEDPKIALCRDADQIYATMMFNLGVYLGLEHEVGGKLGLSGSDFLLRNMNYVRNIGDNLYLPQSKDLHKQYRQKCLNEHLVFSSIYIN